MLQFLPFGFVNNKIKPLEYPSQNAKFGMEWIHLPIMSKETKKIKHNRVDKNFWARDHIVCTYGKENECIYTFLGVVGCSKTNASAKWSTSFAKMTCIEMLPSLLSPITTKKHQTGFPQSVEQKISAFFWPLQYWKEVLMDVNVVSRYATATPSAVCVFWPR